MTIRLILGVCLLACLSDANVGVARTITVGEKPVNVDIRYGKATVLRFDAKVSSVQNAEKYEISALNEQSPNYAELQVKPRSSSVSEVVTFHLADGNLVKLKLVPVTGPAGEALETFHAIKRKDQGKLPKIATSPESDPSVDDSGKDDTSKVELMKALILGGKARGYQIKSLEKPLKTGLSGVDASLVRVYSGKELNGYVFHIVSHAAKSTYEIDIRRLKLGEPNLALMSQVDRKTLEPESTGRNEAFLTIVARPSSLSREVVLPVTWVKKEAK